MTLLKEGILSETNKKEAIKMDKRYEVSTLKFGDICVIDTTKKDDDDDKIIVSVETETKARIIADLLNEKEEEIQAKPLDLHVDFVEWDNLISKVDKNARKIVKLEEKYQSESDRIIRQAIDEGFDFKGVYGGNNQSTRKQYADEQLHDLKVEIRELKFEKDDCLRRISFIKSMIELKLSILEL